MLRRQQRLRREYLVRKSHEEQKRIITEKKQTLKKALDERKQIPSNLRKVALDLQHTLDWDDLASEQVTSHQDDEYRWAGVEDPKVVVTTSRDPSSRLKMFAKEFKLVIPNSQRINRGNYQLKQLVESCRANAVTDFVVLHETRGEPDGLVICHLPFGPTAYFQLLNTVMRHDIPEVGTMSEAYPHLVLHNLTSKLGVRVGNILKYLFPVPKADSKRVITFANQNDYISFRHHVYKQVEGGKVEIAEVGPRFELRLYQIKLGTLEMENAIDTEWAFKPYMNTTKKRQFLSDGTANDDDDVSGGKKEHGKEESRTGGGRPSFK